MYEWKGGNDVTGIPGIPARDLTDDEAKAYGVTKNRLYKHVDDPVDVVREEPTDGGHR